MGACIALNETHPSAVAGLLTTVNEAVDRVAMHAVRRERARSAGAHAAGLPLRVVPIPHPCPNEVYEARMAIAVADAVSDGFTHVAFGDLFLEDVRRYREERLAGTGLEPLFPVWGIPTARLAEDMIEEGLQARLSCIDTRVLDTSFAGRAFDRSLLDDLPRTRRSVRRERRVPHLRECRADVRERTRTRDSDKSSHANRSSGPTSSYDTYDPAYPSRIVCLTEETTETLYLLGEGHRVVGVSGYTVRPPEARRSRECPRSSARSYDRIEALQPDLILAFSDLQATSHASWSSADTRWSCSTSAASPRSCR